MLQRLPGWQSAEDKQYPPYWHIFRVLEGAIVVVGEAVGGEDGFPAVGFAVGIPVGTMEGRTGDGSTDGSYVGSLEGLTEGSTVGFLVGMAGLFVVGFEEGENVTGFKEGTLAAKEGMKVGFPLGLDVGTLVREVVGTLGAKVVGNVQIVVGTH